MGDKKIYPNAKTERRLLLGRPRPGGIKRLIKRVVHQNKNGKPKLPFDYFLKELDDSGEG